MSKPIDQELLPCPFCGCQVGLVTGFEYHTVRGDHSLKCPFLDDDPIASAEEWNTRAQQPAGVAVPERYGWVAAGRFFTDRSAAFEAAEKTPCIEVYSRPQLLAAAPHPVSGEQKADALRKRFSDIEDEIMAGKHNAASVFTAMRTAALYIGNPSEQDVAGLVEALEGMLEYFPEGHSDGECFSVEAAREALAAHRAQQGERS